MTRMLSELLDAAEPTFSTNVRGLEKVSGAPNADIQLTTAILQQTQSKLLKLGLDPHNTTGEELYRALEQRLLADDARLKEYMGLPVGASSPEVLAGVRRLVRGLDVPRSCFALKNSVAKRLLKTLAPAKTMKQLGYRSLESMLKHEPLPQLYTATLVHESPAWQRQLTEKYRTLRPSDFESRQIEIFYPTSRRWERLAEYFANRFHHTHATFKELGAVVVLPVTTDVPALGLTSVLLLLESFNDIRSSSTFLKLQQVKPDFGVLVSEVVSSEPLAAAELAGLKLPWRSLQHYFDTATGAYDAELFEPHVQPEDLKLAHAEVALAKTMPALEFWMGTAGLALVDRGQVVSLNMLDVALSAVNSLPFDERSLQHVRKTVWHDLLAHYLDQHNLEQVVAQLSDALVEPRAELAEELA
jgi:hypothetical protein